MNSLVLDFENKINDSKYSITDLLRHCLIIARKLKQNDFADWINYELNGYLDVEEIPNYRRIPVSVKFLNPKYGWCPYVITDEEFNKELSKLPIRNPISEIEFLASSDTKTIHVGVPSSIKNTLLSSIEFDSDIIFQGNKNSMIGILDAVKNEMLNWILTLEENGIIDENSIFNNDQIQKAGGITSPIINKFYGDKNKIDLSQIINK